MGAVCPTTMRREMVSGSRMSVAAHARPRRAGARRDLDQKATRGSQVARQGSSQMTAMPTIWSITKGATPA